jgi:hypothetical protein
MSGLKAVLTFDDSWDDEAVRNAFADNDQFPGVTVAEVTSAACSGCARQNKGSAEQQTDNSDYTAALYGALIGDFNETDVQFIIKVVERLNSAKAPNCA